MPRPLDFWPMGAVIVTCVLSFTNSHLQKPDLNLNHGSEYAAGSAEQNPVLRPYEVQHQFAPPLREETNAPTRTALIRS